MSVSTGRGRSAPVSAETIRREAIRLFGERTYPVIGMRDLSEAVGILPGSLYAHITSKEDLLLEIVEGGIHNYLDALRPIATSDAPADERLRDVIARYLEVLANTREHTRVTFNQWEYLGEENQQKVLALRQEYLELFKRVLIDGIDSGVFRPVAHPKIAALSIIGMLNSATEWFDPKGPKTAQQLATALTENVVRGLHA